jgi:type I restriction enzyme M protein
MTQAELASFIWSVADLIRGSYRPPQYERVMLPMTVLRRFDCVLESTKPAVLKRHGQLKDSKVKKGFSENVRDIFLEYFEFEKEIEKLDEANRLYLNRFQVRGYRPAS